MALAEQALDELEAVLRGTTGAVPGQLERADSPAFAAYGLPGPEYSGRHEALAWALLMRDMVAL
jgi:hypothetical protein